MDTGKKIVTLLACLLCLSLYTFLLFSNAQKSYGFVDGISYSLQSSKDGVKTYTLQNNEKNTIIVERISTNEWQVSYKDSSYIVKGSKNNISITASDDQNQNANKLLLNELVFGPPPIITLLQAVITIVIGLIGVYIISKAEELWYIVYKKDKEQYPKLDEIKIFKTIGGIIIAVAVIVLIVFIVI